MAATLADARGKGQFLLRLSGGGAGAFWGGSSKVQVAAARANW